MTAETASLLGEFDRIEAECAAEQWEQAEQRMAALDARLRSIDWSAYAAADVRLLLERQQRMAGQFIAWREEASTMLKQLSRSQKARASYGGGANT